MDAPLSFRNISVFSMWHLPPPKWKCFYFILQEALKFLGPYPLIGKPLLIIILKHVFFSEKSSFRPRYDFIWSIALNQVYFHSIYVRQKEKHSIQKKYTKFWQTEICGFFRRHWHILCWLLSQNVGDILLTTAKKFSLPGVHSRLIRWWGFF